MTGTGGPRFAAGVGPVYMPNANAEDNGVPERRHPSASSTDPPLDGAASLEGVRVLVVDDELDARALVRRLLENCKAEVTAVGSAAEAIDAVQTLRPDVLVSDIGMPGGLARRQRLTVKGSTTRWRPTRVGGRRSAGRQAAVALRRPRRASPARALLFRRN
jgi:CheY-like chemotaxis protein